MRKPRFSPLLLALACGAAPSVVPPAPIGPNNPPPAGTPADTTVVLSRTQDVRATDVINVMDAPYLAFGRSVFGYTDGVIAANSTAFYSPSANFAPTDVGKVIVIDGAGPAYAPLVTTIAAYVDAHDVTLAAPATNAAGFWTVNNAVLAAPGAGYVPGSTLTPTGGTFTTAATLKLVFTQVVSAAVNAAGSGGTTGACVLTGTTGTQLGPQKFTIAATISGGAISALGAILTGGLYTTNPTLPSAEPVTSNCGLTGATLTLGMGAAYASNLTPGVYAAAPSSPAATSSTDAGTGATLTLNTSQTSWGYGYDDTAALNAALVAASAKPSGRPVCVYLPAGVYLVTPSTTVILNNFCVLGDASFKTIIVVAPNTAGNIFSVSQNWAGAAVITPNGASTMLVKNAVMGPTLHGLTIVGYRSTSQQQNGLILYDENDEADILDLSVYNLRGRAFFAGSEYSQTQAYLRESWLQNLRLFSSGDTATPVFEISAAGGGDASNEIDMDSVKIFSPYGPGFVIRNAATANAVRQIRVTKLRVEGLQNNPTGGVFDLIDIGDTVQTGTVSHISLQQVEAIGIPYGGAGVRIKAGLLATAPSYIDVEGTIPNGVYGQGFRVDAGSDITGKFVRMLTNDYNLWVSSTAYVAGPVLLDGYGALAGWTSSIDATATGLIYSYPYSGFRGITYPGFSVNTPDSTAAGGNARGLGATDMQQARSVATQIASGIDSVIGGGSSNQATASQAVVEGGLGNIAGGLESSVLGGLANYAQGTYGWSPGGAYATDRTRYGAGCFGSGRFASNGDSQGCELVFRGSTNGTAAIQLTADGTGASSGANCGNLPSSVGGTYNLRAALVAIDTTTPANAFVFNANYVLSKGVAASTTTLGVVGTPTSYVVGSASGVGAGASADTTNGCIKPTFTPPTGNSDTWRVVERISDAEVTQ